MRKVLSRFNLTKNPFSKELDLTDSYKFTKAATAIRRLKATVEGRSSAVLCGEAGVGKTVIVRGLESQLAKGRYRLTYLHNSTVNPRDFYRQLGASLGWEPKAPPAALFRTISQHIEELASDQKLRPVLILDEAHLLPLPVLNHLHILLNFRRDSRSFLSIILVGLPELRNRLRRNLLSSLAARLPVRINLDPLSTEEVGQYITHRMEKAGCSQEVFSEEAILLIAEATGRVMRKIDVLSWECLKVASERKSMIVEQSVVEKALIECAEAIM